jgi:glucose/arabinose dehydrogenase
MRRARWAGAGLAAVLVFTGCAAPEPAPTADVTSPARTPTPTPTPTPTTVTGLWAPTGDIQTLAEGLHAPWSVVPLEGGGALISQRDDGRVLELTAAGDLRSAGQVGGVRAGGEGGLLGLALRTDGGQRWLYAYFTAADDNRVVRMPLQGVPGAIALGSAEVVIAGIAKSGTHNGGRIAFGPDGMLYVATGDAGNRDRSQDEASLNGKILRLTPDGAPAPGNPFGTEVWSLGHRNVQGMAWTSDGTMWASEFGQDTWDELNVIEPGGNYGWPIVEGRAGDDRFVDPLAQWRPSDASPSGLAAVGDTLFLAGLRGQRLWIADTSGAQLRGEPRDVLAGEYGRLRDAIAAPDGTLWLLTNNTDGRGSPHDQDDRLLQLTLSPAI